MPEEEQPTDEEEDEDYAADFISQMIESPSKSPSSPLDLLAVENKSEDDKMDRLMESIGKHNERVIDSATGGSAAKMQRHPVGMFGLTAGVFIGDTFVREPFTLSSRLSPQKGFGKKSEAASAKAEAGEDDRFATWHIGVQKVALQFEWDYSVSVSQTYTYGKVRRNFQRFSSHLAIRIRL